MNSYEEKQEARRARYEEKASRLRDEAHRLHDQAHEMASAIPFGQPILVGHHSEGRDRRYRDRIHNTFGKAFATMDKADYYKEKAAKVGSGGISSDDPDALDKLNDKLENLRRNHEFMKAANAAIRKGKTPEAKLANLMALGVSEGTARDFLKPDCLGRVGFAPTRSRTATPTSAGWSSASANWSGPPLPKAGKRKGRDTPTGRTRRKTG